jgi:uncharacterized membrane protein YfcA
MRRGRSTPANHGFHDSHKARRMEFGLPAGAFAGDIAMLAAALIAGGLIAGLLSGLFGVGGGGILVPVLYELLAALGVPADIRMHVAVGTAFAIIIPTGLRSSLGHYWRGAVDVGVLRTLAPAIGVGIVIGLMVARYTGGVAMQAIWVFSAVLIASYQFFGDRSWRLGQDMPGLAVQAPVGIAIGMLATLMGVGGAAFLVPFMMLYGRPVHQAVGTASGVSPLIAIPAMLGYIWAGWNMPGLPAASLGYVSLLGAALIIPTSVLAAPWGVRLAHGLTRRQLELGFGVFITLVALRFIYALISGMG